MFYKIVKNCYLPCDNKTERFCCVYSRAPFKLTEKTVTVFHDDEVPKNVKQCFDEARDDKGRSPYVVMEDFFNGKIIDIVWAVTDSVEV